MSAQTSPCWATGTWALTELAGLFEAQCSDWSKILIAFVFSELVCCPPSLSPNAMTFLSCQR